MLAIRSVSGSWASPLASGGWTECTAAACEGPQPLLCKHLFCLLKLRPGQCGQTWPAEVDGLHEAILGAPPAVPLV